MRWFWETNLSGKLMVIGIILMWGHEFFLREYLP